MRIALLPPRDTQDRLFTAQTRAALGECGELVSNDRDTTTPDTVAAIGRDAEVLVTSWGCPALDAGLLAALPACRAVVHAAGSIRPVMSAAAWDRGIRFSSGREVIGRGVAETALGLTITSLKNVWRLARSTAGGGWAECRPDVRELYDVTVGVIGAGVAGRWFVRLLQGFEVDVCVYDPTLSADQVRELGATKAELADLLSRSDVVSVHAPSIPATRHLLDAPRLALMQDGAILVNTARGSIVDEGALAAELAAGRLFACLDVTDPEPPAPDSPLRSLPNCVLTPHVAGAVTNGLHRLGRYAVGEVRRYAAGQRMAGEIDRAEVATMA